MIEHPRWRDAEAAANRLTESDRRSLLLLVRLPLIWEAAIERLYGLSGGASVYRCLARLRTMGLITEMRPALRPVRNPSLFHLTDLGIATVAVDRQVDPEYLARRARLRGTDLLALLACLPHVLAVYDLLAALADSRTGRIDLLAWEQPWRRTFTRSTRRAPISVELPAHAVLSWGSQAASCLLVPDLATFPFHVHRHLLAQLLAMRHLTVDAFPTLVVATTDARQAAWHHLLRDVARERGEAPLSG
ncbi:MAG: replication-relaxation family protein, partial [Chloroflexi bacterium]|nr:replication-relaxation family protein [Chloroflexota bacterium]